LSFLVEIVLGFDPAHDSLEDIVTSISVDARK
jgi:hypothetical protein